MKPIIMIKSGGTTLIVLPGKFEDALLQCGQSRLKGSFQLPCSMQKLLNNSLDLMLFHSMFIGDLAFDVKYSVAV